MKVGVLLSLSGTLAEPGAEMMRGIELAIDEANNSELLGDYTIEVVTRDDASNPSQTASQMSAMIAEGGLSAVLGPHSSSSTREVTGILTREQMPVISPTSAAEGLGAASDYLFRSSLTVSRLVPSGIRITLARLRYTRVGTIVNTADAFSVSNDALVDRVIAGSPQVSVVGSIEYSREQTVDAVPDLATDLADLKAADPEVVFVSGLPTDRVGVLLQMYAAGLTDVTPIVTLLSISDVNQIVEREPSAAEGALTIHVWTPAVNNAPTRAFLAGYRAAHGKVPGDYTARGYAAAFVLADALSRAQDFEPASVRSALAATRGLDTIYGPFSFDTDGDAIYEATVARVQRGEFVPVNQ